MGVLRQVFLFHRFLFRNAIVSNTRCTRVGKGTIKTSSFTFGPYLVRRRNITICLTRGGILPVARLRGANWNYNMNFQHTCFTGLLRLPSGSLRRARRQLPVRLSIGLLCSVVYKMFSTLPITLYSSDPRPPSIPTSVFHGTIRVPFSILTNFERSSSKQYFFIPFHVGRTRIHSSLTSYSLISCLVMSTTLLTIYDKEAVFCLSKYRSLCFCYLSSFSFLAFLDYLLGATDIRSLPAISADFSCTPAIATDSKCDSLDVGIIA